MQHVSDELQACQGINKCAQLSQYTVTCRQLTHSVNCNLQPNVAKTECIWFGSQAVVHQSVRSDQVQTDNDFLL